MASVADGSSGTNTRGSAIEVAAHAFRDKFGALPSPGDEVTGDVNDAAHRPVCPEQLIL
jgi:xanthine dehydrogenase YagR molybdenum-binding subunit